MARAIVISVILVVLLPLALTAQVMKVHSGEQVYRISLSDMDSLTFSEEVFSVPRAMTLDVNNTGNDGGGALWIIEVSALVQDENGNPVQDGIPIDFMVAPEIATISNGYTGNESMDGFSQPGVAFAVLSYNSIVTNDSVTIMARAAQFDIEATLFDYNLPLQGGCAELQSDPANWNYQDENDVGIFEVSIYVYDGHNHCINDQLVQFSSTNSDFWSAPVGGIQTNSALTGPNDNMLEAGDDDECGWAKRYLRVTYHNAFPDPRILESQAVLDCSFPGYPTLDVEAVTINLRQGIR